MSGLKCGFRFLQSNPPAADKTDYARRLHHCTMNKMDQCEVLFTRYIYSRNRVQYIIMTRHTRHGARDECQNNKHCVFKYYSLCSARLSSRHHTIIIISVDIVERTKTAPSRFCTREIIIICLTIMMKFGKTSISV